MVSERLGKNIENRHHQLKPVLKSRLRHRSTMRSAWLWCLHGFYIRRPWPVPEYIRKISASRFQCSYFGPSVQILLRSATTNNFHLILHKSVLLSQIVGLLLLLAILSAGPCREPHSSTVFWWPLRFDVWIAYLLTAI